MFWIIWFTQICTELYKLSLRCAASPSLWFLYVSLEQFEVQLRTAYVNWKSAKHKRHNPDSTIFHILPSMRLAWSLSIVNYTHSLLLHLPSPWSCQFKTNCEQHVYLLSYTYTYLRWGSLHSLQTYFTQFINIFFSFQTSAFQTTNSFDSVRITDD